MNLIYCCCLSLLFIGIAQCLPSDKNKVLDMTGAPHLSKSEGTPRSVNLSFFVPAFSLFALASQFMPQMFPSFTTTTSSRRHRQQRSVRPHTDSNWIENFISNGIITWN